MSRVKESWEPMCASSMGRLNRFARPLLGGAMGSILSLLLPLSLGCNGESEVAPSLPPAQDFATGGRRDQQLLIDGLIPLDRASLVDQGLDQRIAPSDQAPRADEGQVGDSAPAMDQLSAPIDGAAEDQGPIDQEPRDQGPLDRASDLSPDLAVELGPPPGPDCPSLEEDARCAALCDALLLCAEERCAAAIATPSPLAATLLARCDEACAADPMRTEEALCGPLECAERLARGAELEPLSASLCEEGLAPWAGAPPAGMIALRFYADDPAGLYSAEDRLQWKGSFILDESSRILAVDPEWGDGEGPYPTLYDDGPWDEGGHEPRGEQAGDRIWSVEVYLPRPRTALTLRYGLRAAPIGEEERWLWPPEAEDGRLEVLPDAEQVSAPRFPLSEAPPPPEERFDLRLSLDLNNLSIAEPPFDAAAAVEVQGSSWDWVLSPCRDDGLGADEVAGDGICSFLLSALDDELLQPRVARGERSEFLFSIGGRPYKLGDRCARGGVSAAVRRGEGPWEARPVELTPRQELGANCYLYLPSEPLAPWAGEQPEGTVALSFTVDDQAQGRYGPESGLRWKGSFIYDAVSRRLLFDPLWADGIGPYVPLYDDGPWDAGGHEGLGEVAGDQRYGATAFITAPEEPFTIEYGVIDGEDQWI